MLIFNNELHYKRLIENGFEKYPNKRDLVILCQEWLKEGYSKKELKSKMESFCQQWNSQFNYAKTEGLLLKVLMAVDKLENEPPKFVFNTNIVVFESEINKIKELKDKNLQKIAFIMVCLAKWKNSNFIYLNYDSTIKLKDIFDYAGIKATGKKQLELLHKLNLNNFVDCQLRPLGKFIIDCITNDGDVALSFKINEEMIQNWIDLVCPHCERCGKGFEKNSNKQKYCKECAKIVKNEQTLQIMREKRKNKC